MHPIAHIRKNVFKLSQAAFGTLAGVDQGTVSRWEGGQLAPDLAEMARIRTAARRRRLPWDDSWFFSVPAKKPQAAA